MHLELTKQARLARHQSWHYTCVHVRPPPPPLYTSSYKGSRAHIQVSTSEERRFPHCTISPDPRKPWR